MTEMAVMHRQLAALGRVAKFYPSWYLARWFGRGQMPASYSEFGALAI